MNQTQKEKINDKYLALIISDEYKIYIESSFCIGLLRKFIFKKGVKKVIIYDIIKDIKLYTLTKLNKNEETDLHIR